MLMVPLDLLLLAITITGKDQFSVKWHFYLKPFHLKLKATSPFIYRINTLDPIWKILVIASHGRYGQQSMQPELGQIINTGSDFLYLIQFCSSTESPDHIVQNQPRSSLVLADCVRWNSGSKPMCNNHWAHL